MFDVQFCAGLGAKIALSENHKKSSPKAAFS
jgi:hypothetical protein